MIYFLLAFLLAFLFTPLLRNLLRYLNILDLPKTEKRKIHKKKIPLGGGLAIFTSFFLVTAIVLFWTDQFGVNVAPRYILALFLGSIILLLGGFLDDKFKLSPGKQILFPILASLVVIGFHIGPEVITNPLGGVFDFSRFTIGDWLWLADFLVFIWLMVMMYATKLLDGLDGLATGIVFIGALIIAFLSLQTEWYQPDLALLAFIFAGACLGFWLWNWHPAKIFLGEGGALFLGFILGCLAIVSGGKIATTLLVMGVPILDMVRVIIRRLQKHQPFYVGDNEHLHFRLLKSGMNQPQAVFFLYSVAFLFGVTTLFLQSRQKIIALAFLFILMLLAGVWYSKKDK